MDIDKKYFHDPDAAREHLEAILWRGGCVCPHCGVIGDHYKLQGKSDRPGLRKCREKVCRKKFTVTVNTVFHRSKIPLNKWLLAAYLMAASKKGISAHQIHRMLGVTYKSAWFMCHRLREAAKNTGKDRKLGVDGATVEIDETYYGRKPGRKKRPGTSHKLKIFSLVERGGDVRSFEVEHVSAATLRPIIREQVDQSAKIMTDEMGAYKDLDKEFAQHSVVTHSKGEYVRAEAYTNTVEGYFSLLKRGIVGTFHHVSAEHLFRYVCEFDFKYNGRHLTDTERAEKLLANVVGKRLLYCAG